MSAHSHRSLPFTAPLYRRLLWRACSRPVTKLTNMSRAYCRAAVRWSLVSAPVGDHDWFWEVGPGDIGPAR